MNDIFFLNRDIKRLLTPDHIYLLKNKLNDLITSDYAKRIHPDLMKKINQLVNRQDMEFTPLTSEVGKTYSLFVSEDGHDSICLILKVGYDDTSNSDNLKFFGSATAFKDNFLNCFGYVAKLIQKNLDEAYFFRDLIKKFELKFLNPLNEPVSDLILYGNSLEYPLCVAIFSAIINEKIDISIACSGNVDENLKITFVDGAEEKIEAAIEEYPEIKKIVLPADCRKLQLEKKYPQINIEYVSDLEEGIKVFFPNFKELLNTKDFFGKISFKDEVVELESGEKAVKISLNVENSINIPPEILNYIDKPLEKILNKYDKMSSRYFLLDNFKPTWFVPAMMKYFVNKSNLVAVHYINTRKYIVVYEKYSNYSLGASIDIKK